MLWNCFSFFSRKKDWYSSYRSSCLSINFCTWDEFDYSQATVCHARPVVLKFELSIQICVPVLSFALKILNFHGYFLDISKIVSYELLFYYKINGVWKVKTISSVWWIIVQLLCSFHSNFQKNLQDSIQIAEAPKRNLNVPFILVDTGNTWNTIVAWLRHLIEYNYNCNLFYLYWDFRIKFCCAKESFGFYFNQSERQNEFLTCEKMVSSNHKPRFKWIVFSRAFSRSSWPLQYLYWLTNLGFAYFIIFKQAVPHLIKNWNVCYSLHQLWF